MRNVKMSNECKLTEDDVRQTTLCRTGTPLYNHAKAAKPSEAPHPSRTPTEQNFPIVHLIPNPPTKRPKAHPPIHREPKQTSQNKTKNNPEAPDRKKASIPAGPPHRSAPLSQGKSPPPPRAKPKAQTDRRARFGGLRG